MNRISFCIIHFTCTRNNSWTSGASLQSASAVPLLLLLLLWWWWREHRGKATKYIQFHQHIYQNWIQYVNKLWHSTNGSLFHKFFSLWISFILTNYHNLVYMTFSLFKSTEDFDYANFFSFTPIHWLQNEKKEGEATAYRRKYKNSTNNSSSSNNNNNNNNN